MFPLLLMVALLWWWEGPDGWGGSPQGYQLRVQESVTAQEGLHVSGCPPPPFPHLHSSWGQRASAHPALSTDLIRVSLPQTLHRT